MAPATLVANWEKEILKWLGEIRLKPLIAMGDSLADAVHYFQKAHYECLIVSYETFRNLNVDCDLLIFDEGHRFKNMNIKLFQSLYKAKCKRRVLLTGTPI